MTGLDPVEDRILEVAAIATDWDFREVATYTAVVRVPDELMQRRMVGGFWQKFPEVKVVLTVQNQSGQSAAEVQRQLLAFVKEYFDSAERVVCQ